MAHPWLESTSSACLLHSKAGEGEERGRWGQLKGLGQLMALLNGWNKKIGKLMVGIGNGGFAVDER